MKKQVNMLEKRVTKSIKKFKQWLIILLVLLVGILSSLVILMIKKPVIETSKLEVENIELEEKIINKISDYPRLVFNNLHYIKFSNGNSYLSNDYQTKEDDFTEGENKITLSRAEERIFYTEKSKNNKILSLVVDRIEPEINIKTEISDKIFFKDKLNIDIESENNATLYINDEENNVKFSSENISTEIIIKEGENQFVFKVKDENDNYSDEVKLQFYAVLKGQKQLFECDDLMIAVPENLQKGFDSDSFHDDIFIRDNKEAQEFLKKSQEGQCKLGQTYLSIYPKNTDAPCYNCDQNMVYINFQGITNENYEKYVITDDLKKYLKDSKKYKTKMGIEGDWYYFDVPEINDDYLIGDLAHKEWFFVFDYKNNKYFFSAYKYTNSYQKIFYNNVDKDFDKLINSFIIN